MSLPHSFPFCFSSGYFCLGLTLASFPHPVPPLSPHQAIPTHHYYCFVTSFTPASDPISPPSRLLSLFPSLPPFPSLGISSFTSFPPSLTSGYLFTLFSSSFTFFSLSSSSVLPSKFLPIFLFSFTFSFHRQTGERKSMTQYSTHL